MSDRIRVTGVRAYGRHGFGHELEHPQPFDVDVTLEVDAARAASVDDLGETIDYALVVQEVRRVVSGESFSLLESLAEAVASRLLAFGPEAVEVRVSKPQAAMTLGAAAVAVEVRRTRP